MDKTKLKRASFLTMLILIFAFFLLIIIASYPFKCSLPNDLKATIVTINSKEYIMISSSKEEAIKNPTFTIECIDYKFLSDGKVGITKYRIFNVFSLMKNDPIMSSFPVLIPMDFFMFSKKDIEFSYWHNGSYVYLGKLMSPKKSSVFEK